MLSLLSRKLLTSVSVMVLGIPGIACMSFNVRQISSFDINIKGRKLKFISANIGLIKTKLDGAMQTSYLIRHITGFLIPNNIDVYR
jgi:hypothetical protein